MLRQRLCRSLQPRPELVNPDLARLAQLTPEEFRDMFRGSPVKRAKLGGLRRNAVIAMANSGDERFLPLLQQLCCDEDAMVAEHARWGAKHLLSSDAILCRKTETPASRHEQQLLLARTCTRSVGITSLAGTSEFVNLR